MTGDEHSNDHDVQDGPVLSSDDSTAANPRRGRREALGLSQAEAAGQAHVSVATWKRWEENAESSSERSRTRCERALTLAEQHRLSATEDHEVDHSQFEAAWGSDWRMSPRQALAISALLHMWADSDFFGLLDGSSGERLDQAEPFDQLSIQVLILLNDNLAWAEAARRRCSVVADEIKAGTLPFDRDGCYFDELVMAFALNAAEDWYQQIVTG